MADKLFLVTRTDLPDGDQAVQAAHALQEYNIQFPQRAREWHANSNTLAFLAVPNEEALAQLVERLGCGGISFAAFTEPDLENALTAVAIGPEGKNITSRIPLALSGVHGAYGSSEVSSAIGGRPFDLHRNVSHVRSGDLGQAAEKGPRAMGVQEPRSPSESSLPRASTSLERSEKEAR
jgi:hypothetical protein